MRPLRGSFADIALEKAARGALAERPPLVATLQKRQQVSEIGLETRPQCRVDPVEELHDRIILQIGAAPRSKAEPYAAPVARIVAAPNQALALQRDHRLR